MKEHTFWIALGAAWMGAAVVFLALCRAAARGDRSVLTSRPEETDDVETYFRENRHDAA